MAAKLQKQRAGLHLPTGPTCTNNSQTSSSVDCSCAPASTSAGAIASITSGGTCSYTAIAREFKFKAANLLIEVAAIHSCLLISVLGMLSKKICSCAGGDAPAAQRGNMLTKLVPACAWFWGCQSRHRAIAVATWTSTDAHAGSASTCRIGTAAAQHAPAGDGHNLKNSSTLVFPAETSEYWTGACRSTTATSILTETQPFCKLPRVTARL